MSTATPLKVLFYPAWVSSSGRTSLRWGKPCDTPSEAGRIGAGRVKSGEAAVAFVVRFGNGERVPLSSFTYPPSARRIVEHWEALWDATEGLDDAT